MTSETELRALAQSIGEHAVASFGRDRLSALSVTLDAADLTATVSAALVHETTGAMLDVADAFAQLEALFLHDAVLRLRFVDVDTIRTAPVTSRPSYAMV